MANVKKVVCHLVKLFIGNFLSLYHIHTDHTALTRKPKVPTKTSTDSSDTEPAIEYMFGELVMMRKQISVTIAINSESKGHDL